MFPNLRSSTPRGLLRAAGSDTPVTFVDTPTMNYVEWLKQCTSSIAAFSASPQQYHVAVIGAGAAGLVAAYELLRVGLNVTLFEAGNRAGGRLYTLPGANGNRFEMGAMRFTPSEQVLHHYAAQFPDIKFSNEGFPDPLGVDETLVAFRGETCTYTPGVQNKLPHPYRKVNDGWHAFMTGGFESQDGSVHLTAPNTITQWLADPQQANAGQVIAAWQAYIDAFGNSSLYEAVVRIFTDPNAPALDTSLLPAQRIWCHTDFEFFGALGTGIGGFGPFFPIGFLDIMRFTINAVETDQHALTTGVDSLVNGFLNQPILLPQGSTTTVGQHLVLNSPVTAIAPKGSQVQLTVTGATQIFDRVIVATSHRSMELTLGLGVSSSGLAETVADAVRRVHMECSSKVFVETAAFWDKAAPPTLVRWPRNVVSDTILRNLYTLTYPDAVHGTGALLFSYTWGDDSVKQQTFTGQDRLDLLLRDLRSISVPFAQEVHDSILPGTLQTIDWQDMPYFFGAFKLNRPGDDPYVRAMFYDFQKATTVSDTGVYIAGDSVGFLGGWVENALQTGLNAAVGVAASLGATITAHDQSPLVKLQQTMYKYTVPNSQLPSPLVTTDRPVDTLVTTRRRSVHEGVG